MFISVSPLAAHLLVAQGRLDDALAAGERALELRPPDIIINGHLAWHHWLDRNAEAAIEQAGAPPTSTRPTTGHRSFAAWPVPCAGVRSMPSTRCAKHASCQRAMW